ncbi:MAG: hypothetical protein CL482_05900 [Acidobacteria bacterium]|nr:hypothetical protein [Acidobacteriota bacterium]
METLLQDLRLSVRAPAINTSRRPRSRIASLSAFLTMATTSSDRVMSLWDSFAQRPAGVHR